MEKESPMKISMGVFMGSRDMWWYKSMCIYIINIFVDESIYWHTINRV